MKITVLSACGKFFETSDRDYDIREDNLADVRLFMEPAVEKWEGAGCFCDPDECGILNENTFTVEIDAPPGRGPAPLAAFLADIETSLAKFV